MTVYILFIYLFLSLIKRILYLGHPLIKIMKTEEIDENAETKITKIKILVCLNNCTFKFVNEMPAT